MEKVSKNMTRIFVFPSHLMNINFYPHLYSLVLSRITLSDEINIAIIARSKSF